jgi:anti-anti-sigma regulatory factor
MSDGAKNVIIDFKDLDYISSAGLRVILKATRP